MALQRELVPARPLAAADEPVAGRQAAEHVDEPAHGEVGHAVGEDVGGVAERDAARLQRRDVDGVVAHAEVDDGGQLRQRADEVGVHAGAGDRHGDVAAVLGEERRALRPGRQPERAVGGRELALDRGMEYKPLFTRPSRARTADSM